MRKKPVGMPWLALFAGAVSLLTAAYLRMSLRYPYYFIWDMDLTTAVDLVRIRSGLHPSHLSHPAFGMYLLLSLAHRAARALDWVSIGGLGDLAASLNPLSGMAELTSFARLFSPFLALGVVLALWLSGELLFETSGPASLMVLAALGTQASLLYQASMVRSELYALFYCALGAACLAASRRVLAGVFLGLAYLTKVQAVFSIALVAGSFLLLGRRGKERATRPLSLVNLIVFVALLAAAWLAPVPADAYTNSHRFILNPDALAFLALLVLCAIPLPGLAPWASDLAPVFSGFLLSFALHFLLYTDPRSAWEHLLLDAKVAFLRASYHSHLGTYARDNLRFLAAELRFNPTPYAANLGLILLSWRGSDRRGRRALAVLACAVYAALVLGARPTLRDLSWREAQLGSMSLALFLALVSRAKGGSRARLPWALAGLLLAGNLYSSWAMPARIDASFHDYGWNAARWFKPVYGEGEGSPYEEAMAGRYAGAAMRRAALASAADFAAARRAASFVFPLRDVTQRELGVVSESFPVWRGIPEEVIVRFPEALRGAVVVDVAPAPRRGRAFEEGDEGNLPLDPGRGSLLVLTRTDLQVLLFVPQGDALPGERGALADTKMRIELGGGARRVFRGLEVTKYLELPAGELPARYFFVILRRFRPDPT